MLLRIEDTDRERSTEPAIAAILDGLSWLGLDWDGDTVYQFSRVERHREVVEQMLASGHAYRCYASPEELAQMREKARAEGKTRLYDGRWRDRDPADAPPGVKPAIRLKAPLTGETVVEDQVQGRVTWQNENLDDFVLLRSDGNPTYMLAVVVDDHDMGVTHIIRGDDHLNNARAADPDLPGAGLDGAGDGAHPADPRPGRLQAFQAPRRARRRCLPGAWATCRQAMRNYLVRLGWSHGDQEIFSTEEMIAAFDLAAIGRSPARFDFAKLESLNGHYMRSSADRDLLAAIDRLLPHLPNGAEIAGKLTPAVREQVVAAMPELKERAKTLVELVDAASFIWAARPLALDDKAATLLTPEARALLGRDHPGARGGRAVDGGSDGTGGARLCRTQERQAWRGRATAASGPDRADHLAWHLQRPGRPGAPGKPGAAARSGRRRLTTSGRLPRRLAVHN